MAVLEKHESMAYWSLRRSAAWWQEPIQDLIEVRGKDAGAYLQTQLTQDILGLEIGSGAPAALVERKGHLRALMQCCRPEADKYWLLPQAGTKNLFDHLEQFHFVEEVEIEWQHDWLRLRLEGPSSLVLLQALSGQTRLIWPRWSLHSLAIPGGSVWVIPDTLSGESGVQLFCRNAFTDKLLQQLAELAIPELDADAIESIRVEAGIPLWGKDMDQNTLLPETGLEKATVNYDKGCYLGQEVIARIRSYGVVPRALMGLVWPATKKSLLPEPGILRLDGKEIGKLTSLAWSPVLSSWLGLAYVHKSQRENGKVLHLELNGQSQDVQIRRLPFYTPPSAEEQAQVLLEQGLTVFAEGEEIQAIPLLEAALQKDPHLADAYESLGVILSRQGRHEEAIAVMQQLAELDPEEPMAQTNLSRFYMLMGDKATAEQHMAEATRLNMLRNQRQFVAEQEARKEQAQKEELMGMFREVLENEDPDDLVANFGLGKALLDLKKAEEALPYLQKATSVDPLYSAAWLQLGKAHESLGQFMDAWRVYTVGMEAANEKGDLMPLKEMEQRRQGLKLPAEEHEK